MKSIGFIPARCGSKEIPLKNIKMFCGKPLIYWTLKSLELSPEIDEIILATDCEKIATVAENFKLDKLKIFRRSAESATDKASTEIVMLEYIKAHNLDDNDLFVLLQATSPFTSPEDISDSLTLIKDKKTDSLLSCAKTNHFFWTEDGKAINYDYHNRPRRQDFRGNLQENGALYISKVKNIRESKNRLSGKITVYKMPDYSSLELDKPYEWNAAEAIMRNHNLHTR